MTTKQLYDLCKNIKVRGKSLSISPDEVYNAASLAQDEILSSIPMLEGRGYLTLHNGQRDYSFQELNIENVTELSKGGGKYNYVIKITSHPFGSGDSVIVSNVGGMTGANGKWRINVIDSDNFELLNSEHSQTGTYTGGGKVYHELMAAWEVKRIFRLSGNIGSEVSDGEIMKTSDNVAENKFSTIQVTGSSSNDSGVINFYEIMEENIRLVFYGTPTKDQKTMFHYKRVPLPCEAISSTVNPIVPDKFRNLLKIGTTYYILQNYPDSDANELSLIHRKLFDIGILNARRLLSNRRFIRETKISGIRWNR